MADFTPQQAREFLSVVPGALTQAIETEQAIAIIDTEGDIKQAVFFEGEDTSGGQIGTYSTKPLYVHIPSAIARYGSQIPTGKLKARGKPATGRKRGSTARVQFGETVPLQSQYFPDGYSGFRSLMGRPIDKVNLKLTGDTAGSIASGTQDNVSTIAFTNDKAAKKAKGHEEKYGKTIYQPQQVAVDALFERLNEAADKVLKDLLK